MSVNRFYASQSIVFVNYVFRSDGSKPIQDETETGIYDILAKLKTLWKDTSRRVLHLLNCSCTRPAGFPWGRTGTCSGTDLLHRNWNPRSLKRFCSLSTFSSLFFSHTRHNCRKYFDTFIQKHDKTAILLILKVESFESYAATSFCSTMNVMGGRTTAKEKRLRKSNKRILG